jgi:hypothetical protein
MAGKRGVGKCGLASGGCAGVSTVGMIPTYSVI